MLQSCQIGNKWSQSHLHAYAANVFIGVNFIRKRDYIWEVRLRREGGYAFSKKSVQDKNVIDHSSWRHFEFSELKILRMPPGGKQSSQWSFFIRWGVTGYIARSSMPYSRPDINAYVNNL